MTRENAKDFLPLVEALAKGELQAHFKNGWRDLPPGVDVSFAKPITHYRIRPKNIECWAVVSPNGAQYLFSIEDQAKQCAINNGRIVHLKEV